MGIANTDEWLRQIAKYTGKEQEVEALIEEEHKKWLPKLKAIRHEFENFKGNGEKVEVLGALGQGRLLAQIPYFDELGLKSSAAMCQDFDNLILKDLERLLARSSTLSLCKYIPGCRTDAYNKSAKSRYRNDLPVSGRRI